MVKQTKAYKWTGENVKRIAKVDIFRFGIVGSIGFVVTLFFKSVFHQSFGLPVSLSIFMGSEMGLLSNFVFHEKWTYNSVDHSHKSLLRKFITFQISSLGGVIIFTIIGNVLVVLMDDTNSVVALMIAAGITMFWNYFWTKYLIFKGKKSPILINVEETLETKESFIK